MKNQLITIVIVFTLSLSAVADDLTRSLAAADRDPTDKARDAGRKPADVLNFLGVEPGMRALDVIAASGYYTEVLSIAVGSEGRVFAQNPLFVLKFRDGANDKALSQRLANNRLSNVRRIDGDINALGIERGSVDLAITALNFHDIYNREGKEAAVNFSKAVMNLLKPGGVFGVIDHEGSEDANNADLHRMQSALAIDALESAGYQIQATSDLLRNPNDDLSQMVFAPEIRGWTDRFLIKAVKP